MTMIFGITFQLPASSDILLEQTMSGLHAKQYMYVN